MRAQYYKLKTRNGLIAAARKEGCNTPDTIKKGPILDAVAARLGRERIRDEFYNLYKTDKNAALRALGDEKLKFATLYALRPEISKLGLEAGLNERSAVALRILREISSRTAEYVPRQDDKAVLRWMFDTGCKETGLGSQYDGIMDAVAALLIKAYKDKSCLPGLCDMIFDRHRLGSNTYDAEWAFFECGDPECLAIAAKRLLSGDGRDIVLAQRLLGFLPCLNPGEGAAAQYKRVAQWLQENKPYLCYTGESCLMRTDPCRFKFSPESKYLQKPVFESGGGALSYDDRKRLEKFAALDEQTQTLLGERSRALYAGSPLQWKKWMSNPVEEQIKSSNRTIGKDFRHGNRRR